MRIGDSDNVHDIVNGHNSDGDGDGDADDLLKCGYHSLREDEVGILPIQLSPPPLPCTVSA